MHYNAPHSPWIGEHPQSIVDSYDDCAFESCPQEPRHPWATGMTDENLGNREALKGYFAAVTAMDSNVGRLLDRLERHGLRDSTLVVFLSDNGFSCGHHGFWGKGNGTNPRNMYENSIKVPAVFSHPGRIPEGRAEGALVSAYDVMPTLLEYLDLPVPKAETCPARASFPSWRGGHPKAGSMSSSTTSMDRSAWPVPKNGSMCTGTLTGLMISTTWSMIRTSVATSCMSRVRRNEFKSWGP